MSLTWLHIFTCTCTCMLCVFHMFNYVDCVCVCMWSALLLRRTHEVIRRVRSRRFSRGDPRLVLLCCSHADRYVEMCCVYDENDDGLFAHTHSNTFWWWRYLDEVINCWLYCMPWSSIFLRDQRQMSTEDIDRGKICWPLVLLWDYDDIIGRDPSCTQ